MKSFKNVITNKMKKELEKIEGTFKDVGNIEGTTKDVLEKVEEVVRNNNKKWNVWESEYLIGWGQIYVGNEDQYAIVSYSPRVSEYDEPYIELSKVEEHIQSKKFIKDLYHCINDEVISSEKMEYLSSSDDLWRIITRKGLKINLGVITIQDKVVNSTYKRNNGGSDGDLCATWSGPGFYTGLRGENNIVKMEDVYDELIEEYRSKGFAKPSDDEIKRLHSALFQ